MKHSLFYLPLAIGFSLSNLCASPLPQGDLLASNTVKAKLQSIEERPCMFRTALCPDRCGHATKLAIFVVMENENYSKGESQYGDKKLEKGDTFYVDIKKDIEGQNKKSIELIKNQKLETPMRITILHFYVDKNGSRYPIRPVTEASILP